MKIKKLFGRKIIYKNKCSCHPSLQNYLPDADDKTITLYYGSYRSCKHNHSISSQVIDKKRGYALIDVTMKRWSGYGSFSNGTYHGTILIGVSNGVLFRHRLPGNIATIDEAFDYMKPSEVKNAGEVRRQGDFFFIKMKSKSNFKALDGTRHGVECCGDKVLIKHPQHPDLKLTGKWKAVPMKDLNGISRGD